MKKNAINRLPQAVIQLMDLKGDISGNGVVFIGNVKGVKICFLVLTM